MAATTNRFLAWRVGGGYTWGARGRAATTPRRMPGVRPVAAPPTRLLEPLHRAHAAQAASCAAASPPANARRLGLHAQPLLAAAPGRRRRLPRPDPEPRRPTAAAVHHEGRAAGQPGRA